jgi:protein-disulfide isomerase
MDEVDALVQGQLRELRVQEYQLRSQAVEVLIAQALLEKEAAARGVTVAALEKAEVTDKAVLTEAEAKSFYDANKTRFGTASEADAMRQIREGLGRQRQNERRLAFARELRGKHGVKVLLEPQRVTVDVGKAPVRGNVNAPITVIEFSDFQCPYCVRARPVVARVRQAYGDKVRWVFRHFPLNIHDLAQKAGEASACAGDQGKFWEMHDRLWEANGKLQVAELKGAATALGLDRAAFDACLDSGKHAGLVSADLAAGASFGVTGTPAFFINGRPLVGAQPFEAFQQAIDQELDRAVPVAEAKTTK